MPYLPEIPTWETQNITTTAFHGLNRGLVVSEGEMEDMKNMTSDHFPVLATRAHRMTPTWPGVEDGGKVEYEHPQGMLGTDRLVISDGGKIYIDGVEKAGITLSTDPAMEPKHMVAMGAYVCIWPDKKYINLANPDDYGNMGYKWRAEEDHVITAMMCRKDGRDYQDYEIYISTAAPGEPYDKQLWLDTSGNEDVLKQYSAIYNEWVQVATTYIKIQATGIGKHFKDDDVIFISSTGEEYEEPIPPEGEEGEEGEDGSGDESGGEETTPATAAETSYGSLSFETESFFLNSSFRTTHYGGTNYVSTTATIEERTKVIQVTGIPSGAVVQSAELTFSVSSSKYGAKLLTVNGTSVQVGENKLPVTVTRNGDVSFLFRFQSNNNANVSGSHSGSVTFSEIKLTVTYRITKTPEVQVQEQLLELNSTNRIYARGDDYIIVAGLLRRKMTLVNTTTVELRIPDLDYVTESNNRLWGCSYSNVDGTLTNEIRACALGDIRNWYKFSGTSMDSYVVSIGSDGKFTGACTLRGNPIFWKETCLHKISGTEPSNFTLNTTMCRGVQEGCWRSLAIVNELLLYKSRTDVMAYDGSIPYHIGEKLGRTRWYEAAGAAYLDKYYLCMRDEQMKWSLYVYDTAKDLWHREDDSVVHHMANVMGEMYMLRENGTTPVLQCIGGQRGETEPAFDWMVKFGVFGVTQAQQKAVSRFSIRAQLAAKSSMTMLIQYDSDGVWHDMGTVKAPYLRTFLLPVLPRRCDHCQVVLQGYGDAKIYSIDREYEAEGDGHYGKYSRSANA